MIGSIRTRLCWVIISFFRPEIDAIITERLIAYYRLHNPNGSEVQRKMWATVDRECARAL